MGRWNDIDYAYVRPSAGSEPDVNPPESKSPDPEPEPEPEPKPEESQQQSQEE